MITIILIAFFCLIKNNKKKKVNSALIDKYIKNVPVSDRALFLQSLGSIANWLGVPLVWLLAIMYRESGVRPSAHLDGSDGVPVGGGLIGFLRSTLQDSRYGGISLESLLNLSAIDQLYYVQLYFQNYRNKLKSFSDVSLAVFYPNAIGKKDDYILGSEVSDSYARKVGSTNSAYDLDHDGYVTLAEYKQYMKSKFPELM